MSMYAATPAVKRCLETRAHYAHEWYTPLRVQCPGGPAEEPAATPVAPGLCWAESDIVLPGHKFAIRCDLRAGHDGAHEANRRSMGVLTVWSDVEATTPAAADESGAGA